MKLPALLLTVSLLANAALVGVLALRPGPGVTINSDSSKPAVTAASSTAGTDATRAAAQKSAASAGVKPAEAWDHLQTQDLAALITRLRAAGFPADIIKHMIMELVKERFDAKRFALEKDRFDKPYFVNLPSEFNDPKLGPELRKLGKEQTEMLQQLLGASLNDLFADTEDGKALLRLQIGNIPPEKLQSLYETANKFGEQRAAIYAGLNGGPLLNSDRDKLAAIDQGMRAELAQSLSPAEVDDFVMHSSPTANQLRQVLGPLQPTEAEYRAIFPLYQAFSEQYPAGAANLTPEQTAARQLAQDQLNNQIKGMLGPDQAANYDQAANPAYTQLNKLVGRLDLPLSAAADVAAVQTDVQQRATEIRSDSTLSRAARTTQLNALVQEASDKISTTLGPSGLEAYKTYGGQWLQNIAPRPAGEAEGLIRLGKGHAEARRRREPKQRRLGPRLPCPNSASLRRCVNRLGIGRRTHASPAVVGDGELAFEIAFVAAGVALELLVAHLRIGQVALQLGVRLGQHRQRRGRGEQQDLQFVDSAFGHGLILCQIARIRDQHRSFGFFGHEEAQKLPGLRLKSSARL